MYQVIWGFPSGSGVKNPTAMQEMQQTKVRSLGWEDPLEEGMTTHSSIPTWKISWTERSLVGSSPRGHKELDTTEATEHAHMHHVIYKIQREHFV